MEKNIQINWDKFYRKNPIKEFDLNQTMYTLVKTECIGKENYYATDFMGNKKTYKEIFLNADLLAEAFTREQIREKDTIGILTVGIPIVQELLLASSKIGATSAWIDLRKKEREIINDLNKMNCRIIVAFEDERIISNIKRVIDETDVSKVVIVSPGDYLSPVERTLLNLKNKKEGKTVKINDDKRFIRLKDFLKQDKIAQNMGYKLSPAKFEKERPSIIVGSSGSTGTPKQIIHTEYNFNSAIQKMAYTDLPFYQGNTMHISIPPFIIYGLGNSIYGSLAFTMKAKMNPFVEENTIYSDLGEFDIALGAPLHYRYIYNQILDLQKRIEQLSKEEKLNKNTKKELSKCIRELTIAQEGIRRVKAFVSGGDKIGAEELLEMERLFERPIVNGYGNNESLGAAIVSPMYANKPGSIGIPMKGVEIKIVEEETGKKLRKGNIGELYIKTDSAFIEYLGNKEETNRIKIRDEEGEWIKSGDLAYIDEDGYIIHKGRNQRLINKEAFKISPVTIEEVIAKLPFVKECVVVGVKDEKSGQLPIAFIVLNDTLLEFEEAKEKIEKICREFLPDYEIPSYYHQLEQIPYTPNEKQDFRQLEKIGEEIVNQKKYIKK